jgi:hypothetical protein
MKERIKELWVEGTQTTVPREGDYSSVSAKNIEKFAELIVKECCEIMAEHASRPAGVVKRNVKEHFGVEE